MHGCSAHVSGRNSKCRSALSCIDICKTVTSLLTTGPAAGCARCHSSAGGNHAVMQLMLHSSTASPEWRVVIAPGTSACMRHCPTDCSARSRSECIRGFMAADHAYCVYLQVASATPWSQLLHLSSLRTTSRLTFVAAVTTVCCQPVTIATANLMRYQNLFLPAY
jgi:ferredoxin